MPVRTSPARKTRACPARSASRPAGIRATAKVTTYVSTIALDRRGRHVERRRDGRQRDVDGGVQRDRQDAQRGDEDRASHGQLRGADGGAARWRAAPRGSARRDENARQARGGGRWMGRPRKSSAASPSVSESVGCVWIVPARSSATAPISTASVPSASRSPACGPTRPTPEQPAGCRLEHELGEPVGPPHGDGAPRRAPRHLHRPDLDAAGARLGLHQAAPRDLRVREHDRRDRQGLEGGRVAGGRLRRDQPLRDRLVGEHRLARDVPDGEHARVRRAALGVDHDEAARVPRGAGVLEPEIVRDGTPAHGHQQLVDLEVLPARPPRPAPRSACSPRRASP